MNKFNNSMGYLSIETKNIMAIFSKDELISMFERSEDSDRELVNYDLSEVALITISDPYYNYIPKERLPVEDKFCNKFSSSLKVNFWDVSRSDENYQILGLEIVAEIVEFIKNNKNKRFIINCNAGISRSAGVGLLVEYILGDYSSIYDFKTSFKNLITGHYRYSPNPSVLNQYIKLLNNNV